MSCAAGRFSNSSAISRAVSSRGSVCHCVPCASSKSLARAFHTGTPSPAIIGGRRLKVAATLAYDEFLNTLNWPLGAAVAVLLLAALVILTVGANRLVERRYSQVFE